ncbi:hypothetical protein PoB_002770600 [Plakobranchus ocellatus]|uniref:Uncharacterized protein n=1 Tax=Plakobranchus ocellatus TaxID=259542 RepID=A0AAV4A3D6_9GAST|nr:hypothetical protein PoB_002770600 [Plakobranchus ocellatus]
MAHVHGVSRPVSCGGQVTLSRPIRQQHATIVAPPVAIPQVRHNLQRVQRALSRPIGRELATIGVPPVVILRRELATIGVPPVVILRCGTIYRGYRRSFSSNQARTRDDRCTTVVVLRCDTIFRGYSALFLVQSGENSRR